MNLTVKTVIGPCYTRAQIHELISQDLAFIVTPDFLHTYSSDYVKTLIYIIPDDFDPVRPYDLTKFIHYMVKHV